MKNSGFKSKKLLILSLVLAVTLLAIGFAVSAFAAESTDGYWSFSSDIVKDPMYISEHFISLPRAFEAEVNMPSELSGTSPIISNWTQSDTRDAFGFQISASGTPTMYYYQNHYDTSGEKGATVTTKYRADFTYSIPRNEWVRIAVVNEIDSGSAVYKLYVNGNLVETLTPATPVGVADLDAVYSQSAMRELSIGNDGKYYFKGKLRNVAVYENALTAEEAANTAKVNMQNGDSNLMAYYDATMSGNSDKFFKDQTGNGHNAASAFFERKNELNQYAYSFAFIGDTQFLVEKDATEGTSSYAGPIYDWIVANKDDKKIQRVFGLGDITDANGNAVNEWEHAVALHEKLENAGIVYSIVPGNHDDYASHANKYNSYFSQVEFFMDNIDQTYPTGRIENYYTKFDVGEHKYMVVALEYGAEDDVLEWANAAVAANYDRKVIVITHSLYNAAGEWAQPDTSAQTTTSKKSLNNGIDIWNEFISQHPNIIIAAAGHISADVIKAGKSIGVNGNVVNTFLINPQGFDKATGYDTGMVAMFYFSEDGNNVQVEYVSTTKSLRENTDILFHERNCFSFNVNEVGDSYTYTKYGNIPNSDIIGNKFAIFSNGKFVSAHAKWKATTTAVASLFSANRDADVQILMLGNYTNTDDATDTKALRYANGKLTLDLNNFTFTRSSDFLNLLVSSEVWETADSNIVIKNGSLRTLGKALIANQITNYAYEGEKVWNLTFENVTLGYAETLSSQKEVFYTAWTNEATGDDSQLGTKTNLVFNNCTFDLGTNAPSGTITHFKLEDDHTGVDKIDVTLKINGGKILSDIDRLKNNVVLYTVNEGSDSVIFGDYNGAYTKLVTHTTKANEYEHYNAKFPTEDGNRCFVEISDNGTESVYELRSIAINSGSLNTELDVNTNAKYLSVVDYTFFVLDETGKLVYATNSLYGDSGAVNYAVENVLTANGTVYIVMRDDYTIKSSEKNSNLAYVNGTVILELGGYSLIADSSTGSKNQMFYSDAVVSGETVYPSYFVIRNGRLKTYNTPVIRFHSENANSDVSGKLMSWTFEGVTFGLVSGSTYDRFFHVAYSSKGSTKAPVALNFNDCTIDLETVAPSGNFYIFRTNFADGTLIKADVRINGGKIVANNLANIYFDNFDAFYESTFALGKGSDGEYIKVIIPQDKEFGFQIDTDTFGNITKKTDYGADVSFTLFDTVDSKKIYGIGVESDYGAVPPEYADTEEYPFFVFDGAGKFYGAYNTLLGTDGAMDSAINNVLKSEYNTYDESTGEYLGTAYIVLRSDYTIGASEIYGGKLEQARGNVVIDLGGNTISEDTSRAKDKYLFDSDAASDITYPSYFSFKNGTIRTYKNALIRFRAYNASADVSKNLMRWTFDNVTLGLIEGSSYTRFFHISESKGGTSVAPVELNFNDCTFDLKTATSTKPFYIFRTNFIDSTDIKADIRINGGKILLNNPTSTTNGIYLDNFSNQEGSTMYFGAGSDGEYLKIVLPKGQTFGIYANDPVGKVDTLYNLDNNIAKQTAYGTSIKFYKESSSDTEDIYSFCFDTKYGTVPAKYEDKEAYPFLIFNASGTFKVATDKWALDNGTSALSSSKSSGYVVLLRRDYQNKDGQYNNLSHTKNLTIDLDGFTLKNTGSTLFMAQKKAQNGNEQDTKITIIGGTVILGKRALVKMDTSTTTTSGNYGFDFTFTNLTVKMIDGAGLDAFICQDEFASGDPIQYCNFTFNNCVFDMSNASKTITIFDVSDSHCNVTAVMNGGEMIVSAYPVILWKNYEADPDTVTAHANSSLTFVKDSDGYTKLSVPKGSVLPITSSVNGGALSYVKTAAGTATDTYELVSSEFKKYTPQMSITLGNEFVINVYVPVNCTQEFTFDGDIYNSLNNYGGNSVSINGKDYYLVSAVLGSAEAAKDIKLVAKVNTGDVSATATFTFSIPKYAQKVLANDGATEVEKTLVKDTLAYIKEAYNYKAFAEFNTADEIVRVNTVIESIIGDYKGTPTSSGTTNTAAGVSGVTLNLDAKPTIRFYVTDTTLKFYANSRRLNTVTGTDDTGTYVELDVYAYALCETITYGDGGSYHISSFLAGAAGTSYETLVKCFVKYAESAAAYRNSVSAAD